jgi:hypothetical protein
MFLNDDDKNNYFSFLTEAEDDNAEMPEEPTESDSDMSGGDDGMGEGDMGDDGSGGMDDGMGGDDQGSGDDTAASGDDSLGGDDGASQIDPQEAIKKRMIFNDYKKLLNLIDDLSNAVSYINYDELSPDAKKIFNFIERKMSLNQESIKIILTEKFITMSYRQLLTIYSYMQIATKSYSEMINYFCNNQS